MDRKWLAGGAAFLAIAAVLALVVGQLVGRSIVPSPDEPQTPAVEPEPEPERDPGPQRFTDTLTDVSIAYPNDWVLRMSGDQAVRLVASSPDASAAVSISVRKSDLETVTTRTLPIVRPLTDDLLRQDERIVHLPPRGWRRRRAHPLLPVQGRPPDPDGAAGRSRVEARFAAGDVRRDRTDVPQGPQLTRVRR